MPSTEQTPIDPAFVQRVESLLGRTLSPSEAQLASSLQNDKSVEMIARELQGAVIADPKKIRPEHSDTANE